MTMVPLQETGLMTPYSGVTQLSSENPLWAPPLDRERIAAYQKYEEIYWNHKEAFKLVTRGSDGLPIYVPNPQTIVNTTAHFFMKGLSIQPKNEGDTLGKALKKLLNRETLLARFHTAKHSGCTRGDFLLHITADPSKPAGSRISVTTLDPSCYFPETDDDDVDKILAVDLVEQVLADPDDGVGGRVVLRRQRYEYVVSNGRRRVLSSEKIYEPLDWWNKDKAKLIKTIREEKLLPERITQIPVYHFKNAEWQGEPFGSSELRGYELIQAGINQAISDEDLALALEGLGVYATDSGRPIDEETGAERDWEIAPARVMEVPGGTFFRRVEGIDSVTPVQDHLKFLVDSMYESSATFRGGQIDAQVAESGVALAIRFISTAAKLEQRDEAGLGKLRQLTFDWRNWHFEYENENLGDSDDSILIELGPKLPQSRKETLNELNNMLDRDVISRKTYREQVKVKLGYEVPENEDETILTEREALPKTAKEAVETDADGVPVKDGPDNTGPNQNKPNESKGNEA